MRHFIFFYKLQNQSGHAYGQYGVWSEKLPSQSFICDEIIKQAVDFYLSREVNILGFNEVSEDDYNSYFDKS